MSQNSQKIKAKLAKAIKETDERLKYATTPKEAEALEAKMVELMSKMMRTMFDAKAPTQN